MATYRRKSPAQKNRYALAGVLERRKKFKSCYKVAGFLLDAFTLSNGKIKLDGLKKAGLIKGHSGDFTKWRQPLIDEGFLLAPVGNYKDKTFKHSLHEAGPRLIKYVAKAVAITQNENEPTFGSRLDSVEESVGELKEAMRHVIEYIDPPHTEEKQAEYVKNPGKLKDGLDKKVAENRAKLRVV